MKGKSKKESMGLLRTSIAQIVIIILLSIAFHSSIGIEIKELKEMPSLFVLLLAVSFISDNVRFGFRGRKTISNVVGFLPMAFIFGPFTAAYSSLVIVFLRVGRRHKEWIREIVGRLNRATHYALIYFIAGIFFRYLKDYNVIIAAIAAITGYRLANSILVDYIEWHIVGIRLTRKEFLLTFLTDYIFALAILPFIALMWMAKSSILELAAIYSLLPLLYMLYHTSNVERLANELKEERDRIKGLNEKLIELSKIPVLMRARTHPEKLLSHMANMLTKNFGYRYAVINLFDVENDRSMRVAYSGFDKEEFERLKRNAPTVSSRFELMRDEFKISNSYFIPQGAIEIKREESFTGEYTPVKGDDAWLPEDVFFIPLIDESGIMIGYISLDSPLDGKRPTLMDTKVLEIFASEVVSALKLSEKFQEIIYRSQIDLQTGLYNHTVLFEYLQSLLMNRERDQKLYLLMLDIDDLKYINDTYGHLVGDKAIKLVVNSIKSSVRKKDFAARYGGDEFAVVLEDITLERVKAVVDKIQRSTLFLDDLDEQITVSIGIALFPDDALDYKALIDKADKALYVAKNRGKAQSCFAIEILPEKEKNI